MDIPCACSTDFVSNAHDGVHISHATFMLQRAFTHCGTHALRYLRYAAGVPRQGKSSILVAVKSLYSINGTVVPLSPILGTIQQVFPTGNVHMFVDEAHGMRIYGPGGGGMATLLGLEN